MALDFTISNTVSEAMIKSAAASLDDYVLDFIYDNRFSFKGNLSTFCQLDPYSHTIFSYDEIQSLLNSIKCLSDEEVLNSLESKFLEAEIKKCDYIREICNLIKLCETALAENKLIVSVGD